MDRGIGDLIPAGQQMPFCGIISARHAATTVGDYEISFEAFTFAIAPEGGQAEAAVKLE